MGTDHGKKKVKTPLKKPKVIDNIKTQSAKTTVSDAKKKSQQVKKKQSKKTTVTDTQKKGQVGIRYNLRAGKKKENIKFINDDDPKYRAKPSSKKRKKKK